MPTDPDRELRQLARAMVADDDPPTIPPWPLDTAAEPRGTAPPAGGRLLAVAAAVILTVTAIGGLVALTLVDDAAPTDAPVSSAPLATVPTTSTGSTPPTTAPTTPTVTAPPATVATPSTLSVPSTSEVTSTASSLSEAAGSSPATSAPPTCGEPPGEDHDYPLQRCDAGLAVAVLRQELVAKGYLPPSTENLAQFDDEVVAAVRAFQADHGLVVDGLVGPLTWAAITADWQRHIGDPNGDGHIDPAEVYVVGDANGE